MQRLNSGNFGSIRPVSELSIAAFDSPTISPLAVSYIHKNKIYHLFLVLEDDVDIRFRRLVTIIFANL